jgi:NitT/TauT family transport system permease protein
MGAVILAGKGEYRDWRAIAAIHQKTLTAKAIATLQSYLKVRLPWALPQIFVGFKVAVPLAVIGAVVAENNNPNRGLGSVIVVSMQSLDTPLAFASLLLLAVMSVGLYYLIEGVERVVLPWSRAISAELR